MPNEAPVMASRLSVSVEERAEAVEVVIVIDRTTIAMVIESVQNGGRWRSK